MGRLVDGKWDTRRDRIAVGGRFARADTQFRNWVTVDGSPGPTGEGGFKAEPGRYHLYVSLACPWAHRTLIFRKLKKLTDAISISIVDPRPTPIEDVAHSPTPSIVSTAALSNGDG